MIAPLRNLARRWANARLVAEADQLRRDLIRARAAIQRQTQTMRRGEHALYVATGDLAEAAATVEELRKELTTKDGQIERQADLFDEYRDEIAALRREIADADNTAARDEARQP